MLSTLQSLPTLLIFMVVRYSSTSMKIVKALVAYDINIGQRNWQEYTAFGEARMNNHTEVC